MMTVELGACEWFVWDLRRSNLVERGRLEQVVADFMSKHPKAEPADLASFLVNANILTRFQADSLLNGKSQGLVLGPFIVQDILGSGTMGTVYKARSKVNNEWYAVKVLPRRSMWNIRLARRKVRDFEQFQHPAVIPFVDVGTSGAMHYLAWPLVEGEPLNRIVERQGRLHANDAALFGLSAAEGLEAAHQRGILHGLLKPSNLMIVDNQHVRILDFGVGSLLLESESGESVVDTMSSANTLASGLDCASPEGIMDPSSMTIASDQYSLGCILYYSLTGQFPFPGNNAVEKMMAHQTKPHPQVRTLAPDAPEELIEVVDKLLKKNPNERYGSMAEVAHALRPFVAAVPTPSSTAVRAPQRRQQAAAPAPMHARQSAVQPAYSEPTNGTYGGATAVASRTGSNSGVYREPAYAEPPSGNFGRGGYDNNNYQQQPPQNRRDSHPTAPPRSPRDMMQMQPAAPPPPMGQPYYQQQQQFQQQPAGIGVGTVLLIALGSMLMMLCICAALFFAAYRMGYLDKLLGGGNTNNNKPNVELKTDKNEKSSEKSTAPSGKN